jgi:hypothetical protein
VAAVALQVVTVEHLVAAVALVVIELELYLA